MHPPPHPVTLVLCTQDGTVLGSLPPFEIDVPYWPEAAPVVSGARALYGIDVTVLRLLEAVHPGDGAVTYLAEVADRPERPLAPWSGSPTAPAPHRQTWAEPGGPAADVAWADAALEARGTPRTGPAIQQRTWNLSSLWRLPADEGACWLKVVPPFFGHEGRIIDRLQGEAVPVLLAFDGPRALLAEAPGSDLHDAPLDQLVRMVDLLTDLQRRWAGRADELLALGLPDWRSGPLTELAADVVERTAPDLDAGEVRVLDALVAGLAGRFTALDGCGIPTSLVHGDFHPGNVCGTEQSLVLLDWGDCGVGHPMLDQAAFLARRTDTERALLAEHWADAWRAAAPGSDPDRAAALVAPVAALRQAVIYRMFLDNIEDDEKVYHAADPRNWLRRTASLVAESS